MFHELTKDDYLAMARRELLEAGGVENWEWYSDSLSDYDYDETGYEIDDAHDWLRCLDNGGVDNWAWHDQSITGLAEYEEYLDKQEEAGTLSNAASFREWESLQEEQENAANNNSANAEEVSEANDEAENSFETKDEAEQMLFDYLIAEFTNLSQREVETMLVEKFRNGGFWKANAYPNEYKAATNSIKNGGTLLDVRNRYVQSLIKNGKAVKFAQS